MARRRHFLTIQGWTRRTAPETKRAARNSTIFLAIPWPKDPARYLRAWASAWRARLGRLKLRPRQPSMPLHASWPLVLTSIGHYNINFQVKVTKIMRRGVEFVVFTHIWFTNQCNFPQWRNEIETKYHPASVIFVYYAPNIFIKYDPSPQMLLSIELRRR